MFDYYILTLNPQLRYFPYIGPILSADKLDLYNKIPRSFFSSSAKFKAENIYALKASSTATFISMVALCALKIISLPTLAVGGGILLIHTAWIVHSIFHARRIYKTCPPNLFPIKCVQSNDVSGVIFSYLTEKDLARAESVNRRWLAYIDQTDEWKLQCQRKMHLSSKEDPFNYWVEAPSYKKLFHVFSRLIFDAAAYRYILGAEVGPIPKIPAHFSVNKIYLSDPFAPQWARLGMYTWIYVPPYFEITVGPDCRLKLDKVDDPNDPEAPQLIEMNAEENPPEERRVLQVPTTLHNLEILFKSPKKGSASSYVDTSRTLMEEHMNQRTATGWVCMRKEVFGRGQSFQQQQATALAAGMVIPPIQHRVLYNFLFHSFGTNGAYPDGNKPLTFARSSTTHRDLVTLEDFSIECGFGDCDNGLMLSFHENTRDYIGAAAAFPMQDPNILP